MTRSWLKLMKLCSRDSTHSRHITEANHRIYSLDEIPTNYTAHESTQSYTSATTTWGVYICTTSGGVRIFMYWSSFLNENRIDVKHFNSDSVPIDSPCNIDFRAF